MESGVVEERLAKEHRVEQDRGGADERPRGPRRSRPDELGPEKDQAERSEADPKGIPHAAGPEIRRRRDDEAARPDRESRRRERVHAAAFVRRYFKGCVSRLQRVGESLAAMTK